MNWQLVEDRQSHLSRLLIERKQSLFSLCYFEKMQWFCNFWLLCLNLDVVSQVMFATYFIDFMTIAPNIHLTCPLVYLCLKSKYKLHLRFVLMFKRNAGGHPYFQSLASPPSCFN